MVIYPSPRLGTAEDECGVFKRQKTHRENLYKLVDLSPAFLGPDEGEDTTGALCSEVHGDGSPTQAVHAVTAQQRRGTDSGQASHVGSARITAPQRTTPSEEATPYERLHASPARARAGDVRQVTVSPLPFNHQSC